MKLHHVIITAAALALSGCANPYHELERSYYPQHFQGSKRLPDAEIAKQPKPSSPQELALYRAYRHRHEELVARKQREAQQTSVGLAILSHSLQETAYQMQVQQAQQQAIWTNYHLGGIQRELSGINTSLRYINY